MISNDEVAQNNAGWWTIFWDLAREISSEEKDQK